MDDDDDVKYHEMLMLMLYLWLQAETTGGTHFVAYNRPEDGHFLHLSDVVFWNPIQEVPLWQTPPVYSNFSSWCHLGTKAASGAHLSTSHKIQQYLSPTSENICQYVGGKCLLRGMRLSWHNFLTWYKIFFPFVWHCSWKCCFRFPQNFPASETSLKRRRYWVHAWNTERQKVHQPIQLKKSFLSIFLPLFSGKLWWEQQ